MNGETIKRRKKLPTWLKGGFFGGIIGLLVWLYDYDFLLNMGGASSPISDSIRTFFGNLFLTVSEDSTMVVSKPFNPFFPLLVLSVSFFIFGMIIGYIVQIINSRENE